MYKHRQVEYVFDISLLCSHFTLFIVIINYCYISL